MSKSYKKSPSWTEETKRKNKDKKQKFSKNIKKQLEYEDGYPVY